ncbi:MAG: site-2 protease family protein [Clostridia bacterium]|nr:site-2 protease family protein [Clostridia bacterium]
MITDIIRHGFSLSTIVSLLARVFVVFCTMPVHEYAHALCATKLGDDTARLKGRLTLNPLAHIDPIGAVMIFLVGFGYAKPVPVNARNFAKPKRDMALTAAAGPASNLIMALLFGLLYYTFYVMYNRTGLVFANVAYLFFYFAAYVNVTLGIFNLIPIPPLDGSRILTLFLPTETYFKIMRYERYIMIGVMVLLLTGALSTPLAFISGGVLKGIFAVASLPFKLLRLI